MQQKTLISISEADYQELLRKLESIERTVDGFDPDSSRIITNARFIELMGISPRTAQNWRDGGLIAFSQIQNKIYYRMEDIQDFLLKYRKEVFK